MTITPINYGTAPDNGTGDPLRTSFKKIDDNFKDLDANKANSEDVSIALAQKVDKAAGQRLITDAEATKLESVETGATKNKSDAYLLDRTNHTGTQEISTVSGLQAALDGKVDKAAGQRLITDAEAAKLEGVETGATKNKSDAYLLDRTNHTGTQEISTVNGLAAALDSKVTTGGVAVLSGLNGGQFAGHRNKLINPFTENQRGLSSVSDAGYCIDRWYVLTETGNVNVAIVTDPESGAPSAVRITQPAATAKRMGIAQIIETKDIRAYRNAAMNLSARVKSSFSGNVRYAILGHSGAADAVTRDVVNNWASTSFTAGAFFIPTVSVLKTGAVSHGAAVYGDINDWSVLGADTNNVIIFIWTEEAQAQNATLEINRPQYEPGTIRTPQEWRLDELQLCRRYAEAQDLGALLYTHYGSDSTGAFALERSLYIPFKVSKRVPPAISVVISQGTPVISAVSKNGFLLAVGGIVGTSTITINSFLASGEL